MDGVAGAWTAAEYVAQRLADLTAIIREAVEIRSGALGKDGDGG
jgi:hypothetical protein